MCADKPTMTCWQKNDSITPPSPMVLFPSGSMQKDSACLSLPLMAIFIYYIPWSHLSLRLAEEQNSMSPVPPFLDVLRTSFQKTLSLGPLLFSTMEMFQKFAAKKSKEYRGADSVRNVCSMESPEICTSKLNFAQSQPSLSLVCSNQCLCDPNGGNGILKSHKGD